MMAVAEVVPPGPFAAMEAKRARMSKAPLARAVITNARTLDRGNAGPVTAEQLAAMQAAEVCTAPGPGDRPPTQRPRQQQARGPADDALAPLAVQGLAVARSASQMQAWRSAGMVPIATRGPETR